ncbi:BTB/POZ and MATH domain-containing protein 3-like [Triticum dicoccoides]|uniref:Uncharacterized protein n=1 Tax=Triticum turgidum subsp. durum TaxID=4567 RepID=A0A9R0YZV3_TRITD|nr:BTB/POZ and MATH domain-containing protein 3-like [Triticum dicoccoides]VAI63940.1 unnamed protein product [Triticum turgidum subsp. durum]
MSSFAGVSILEDSKLCPSTTTFVETRSRCGYHLLVVQGYSRTKKETPTGQSIESRGFGVGGHRWSIKYYPNGENSSCSDFVSLYVSRLDGGDRKHVEARFVFSFVDQVEKQNPVYIRESESETRRSLFNGSYWGCGTFMRRDALERSIYLGEDDCFTIRCDIMVCNPQDASGHGAEVLLPDMHHHFNNLLDNKVGTDVKFEVDGETFDAHRCVLAARSKVFMAQLFGPMQEGTVTPAVIQIEDLEAKVFKALLSFIYTDSFPMMEYDDMDEDEMSQLMEEGQETEAIEDGMLLQWLRDLFVAADKYDVQRLKCICVRQLSKHMGVLSVMSTLALAEQHHCQELKEACLKFIQVQSSMCLQAIMTTNGWDHVYTTYPFIVKELIAKLASNQRK